MQEQGRINPASADSFSVEEVLKTSWEKTHGRKGVFIGAFAIHILIAITLSVIFDFVWDEETNPWLIHLTDFFSFAVSMITAAGLMLMGLKSARGQELRPTMVFDAFPQALPLIVLTVISWILIGIGFLFLIIPGIYLLVSYYLTELFLLDGKMKPLQAMEASRKLITRHWFSYFGLLLIMGIVLFLSVLPLGIGLIWTIPWICIVMGELYTRAVDH